MKANSAYLFRPMPIEGEILSSYLARIARANGLSPYRFFSFHFPGVPVWNRDIDRSASDQFLRAVAASCNTSFDAIAAMTLRNFEALLQTQDAPKGKNIRNIAPWINAAGVYHRDRKGFAMQYCPLCLAKDHAYQAIWRLSFVTVCERHRQALQDCCQHCGTQVVFHRNETFHTNCHRCGRPFMYVRLDTSDRGQVEARLQLQTKLLAAIYNGHASMGSNQLASDELFEGLAVLMRVVRAKLRSTRHKKNLETFGTCLTQRIELLRIQDRARQCLVLADLMFDWPNQFLHFAASNGLTQTTFKNEAHCPQWLGHTVAMLPAGTVRVRTVMFSPIRKKLRSLHRTKHENWRTERAQLLLKKAGVRP